MTFLKSSTEGEVGAEIVLASMEVSHIPQAVAIERAHFGTEAWTEGMFESELSQKGTREYWVALNGDVVIGYAGLCVYGDAVPGDRGEPVAWVQNIAVDPQWQGRGAGKLLMDELLAAAQNRSPSISLEVRADDARTQRFYARYGFEPVGRRKNYYQLSSVDAVVMTLHFDA